MVHFSPRGSSLALFTGSLHWLRYFQTAMEEKEFNLDHQVIKEYFPLDVVTKGLLDIYQLLLQLKFEQVRTCSLYTYSWYHTLEC